MSANIVGRNPSQFLDRQKIQTLMKDTDIRNNSKKIVEVENQTDITLHTTK
jgi:hypothetical protein